MKRNKPEDPRQKAQHLIQLAVDEGTTQEERVTAALQAAKLISKYDLLKNPLDSVFDKFNQDETVQAAKSVMDTVTNPNFVDSLKKIGRRISKASRR